LHATAHHGDIEFQPEIGLFFGQQFHHLQPLGAACRLVGKSAIAFNILSADEPV
jgi:hypothetical protein